VYHEYTELASKNNQHRFKDINAQNKITRAYALPGNHKCIVKMLDEYLSLLPSNAPYFYMRVNEGRDVGAAVFTRKRIGINLLKSILPVLSEKSGIEVRYTNHSLRATAITRMFNSGVEEKIIAETSGHKSIKALRVYERTSEQQRKQVTRVINQTEMPVMQPKCNLGGEEDPGVMSTAQSSCITMIPEAQPEYTFGQKSDEDKPVVTVSSAQSSSAQSSSGTTQPNLSGTFSNCTINLCFK